MVVAIAFVVLALTACARQQDVSQGAGNWIGTITTDGDVTTVVKESGSVWGGTATLVEEVSIGVESGAEPYMFGRVSSVVASEDRIYVLDTQIPTVRVYDLAGVHVGNIGQGGEGPGEFRTPDDLAVGPDSAVYVRSGFEARLTIFEPSGELRATWPIEGGASYGQPTVVTASGDVFLPGSVVIDASEASYGIAMIPWGPDGAAGPPILPPEFEVDDQVVTGIAPVRPGGLRLVDPVPFAPQSHWAFGASAELFAGSSADYSFEIVFSDGKAIRVLIVDAFGEDGRYLGQVAVPEGLRERPPPFVRGDSVFGVAEDDAGTIMVKRYRLVAPAKE